LAGWGDGGGTSGWCQGPGFRAASGNATGVLCAWAGRAVGVEDAAGKGMAEGAEGAGDM